MSRVLLTQPARVGWASSWNSDGAVAMRLGIGAAVATEASITDEMLGRQTVKRVDLQFHPHPHSYHCDPQLPLASRQGFLPWWLIRPLGPAVPMWMSSLHSGHLIVKDVS